MVGIQNGVAVAAELSLHRDLNLVVTGYIEPNRPRISRRLAQELVLDLIDVERRIEDFFGDKIENIRDVYGERRLKAIETQIMDDVVLHRRALIRVSGQTLINSGHLRELQRTGVVVCLVASLDAILSRIHLTLGARYHDPTERSVAIGELQSEWKIREFENVHEFDATYVSESELVTRIAAFWRDRAIRRG